MSAWQVGRRACSFRHQATVMAPSLLWSSSSWDSRSAASAHANSQLEAQFIKNLLERLDVNRVDRHFKPDMSAFKSELGRAVSTVAETYLTDL